MKRTLLPPCVDPKLEPIIETGVPATPEFGESTATFGVGMTLKVVAELT